MLTSSWRQKNTSTLRHAVVTSHTHFSLPHSRHSSTSLAPITHASPSTNHRPPRSHTASLYGIYAPSTPRLLSFTHSALRHSLHFTPYQPLAFLGPSPLGAAVSPPEHSHRTLSLTRHASGSLRPHRPDLALSRTCRATLRLLLHPIMVPFS